MRSAGPRNTRESSTCQDARATPSRRAFHVSIVRGPARILGVRDRRRNCKGSDGDLGTVDRGTPGWVPSLAAGRDVEISSFEAELRQALDAYGLTIASLSSPLRTAIAARKSFTLVEGEIPVGLVRDRLTYDEFISKVVRHD